MDVVVLVEPPLDIGQSVAHVSSDAYPGGSVTSASPAVHGGEGDAEVFGELDWAEEAGVHPAIGRCS